MSAPFLVTAVRTDALERELSALRAHSLGATAWLTEWEESAENLARRLRPVTQGPIIVCALTGDWAYH